MALIEMENVCLNYDDRYILRNINESIEKGTVYVLTGGTGSGKSSFLKIIAGLADCSSGSVRIDGKDLKDYDKRRMLEYHKSAGFVFQSAALISNMTNFDNIALYYYYHTDMSTEEIYAHVEPFIDDVGLKRFLYVRPAALSLGEQKLINIVRAIAHEPHLLFFDEPTENLDQITGKKVHQILSKLKEAGKTMIISTHNIDLAFSLADRVGILHESCILKSMPVDEIFQSDSPLVKEYLNL